MAAAQGCGVIVLKRLSDAVRDGDRIQALIRGTAVKLRRQEQRPYRSQRTCSGKGDSPRIGRCWLSPADIGYMEAHGTGTSLGDPIEVESIGRVMQEGHGPDNPTTSAA